MTNPLYLAVVGAALLATVAILGLIQVVLKFRAAIANDYATKEALQTSSSELARRIAETNERCAEDRADFHASIATLRQDSINTDAEIFGQLRKINTTLSSALGNTERALGRIEGSLENLPCNKPGNKPGGPKCPA